MENIQDELIKKLINDFENKKNEIIKQKINELGLMDEFKKDEFRLFRKFKTVIKGGKETIYYDDNSETGLRIITFVDPIFSDNCQTSIITINLECKYY